MSDILYSLKEAARYLDLSVSTVKYHIYQSGLLYGQLIGKTRVFTKEELDSFKAKEHKPGWRTGNKRQKKLYPPKRKDVSHKLQVAILKSDGAEPE